MNAKFLVKTALLIFVLGSVTFLVFKETRQWATPGPVAAQDQGPEVEAPAPAQTATKAQSGKVVAYYFHTTYRCPTCRRIEAYSRETIETGFAKEIAEGRLEFRLVNIEQPENRHFVQDYELFTKSLVLVRMNEGKQVEWTNLAAVWEYNGDKPLFLTYVQGEILKYLEKN
jgi:hypothetical protein